MLFRTLTTLFLVLVVGGLVVAVFWHDSDAEDGPTVGVARPVPVEIAPITVGPLEESRAFSGTLVPRARFVVAAKVAGLVESLAVDVGDPVENPQVVAELDDAERSQAVAEAEAALEVVSANVELARSNLDIAQREFDRAEELEQQEITSGAALELARSRLAAQRARLAVAAAEVHRAQATLETRRVQRGYTHVTASWSGGSGTRVVAERHVDEGATLAANDPILTVVDSSVLRAELFVTEREYGRLRPGQRAILRTDAWPGESFDGEVLRLAPIFEEASRQTRVEVRVPNADGRLRPGMYVRATVVLDVVADAISVPRSALVRSDTASERGLAAPISDESFGVFVIDGTAKGETITSVRFVPVRPGIEVGERVQLLPVPGAAQALDTNGGWVVAIGQLLLADGSQVRIAGRTGEGGARPPFPTDSAAATGSPGN